MKIVEKLQMNLSELLQYGPINIVAFGDSITHGALNVGEMDYETVYHNRLKKKINAIGSYYPVNVINAGIGGMTAERSLERMDSHVLKYDPDLVIVCFGLNDVSRDKDVYLNSLKTIFDRCNAKGADVIFMTPNMLNTYVAEDTHPARKESAKKMAFFQTSGRMDDYMLSACEMAQSMNVTVCDCYAMWKRLSETQDTTMLLANRINHPTREMHELFAQSLFDTIFSDSISSSQNNEPNDGTAYAIKPLGYQKFFF
jgi:hypothetical protein